MGRCPNCRGASAPRAGGNTFAPFCGERCKLIDLGKWLGEEYRVPAPPPREGDEAEQVDLDRDDLH